MATDIVTMRSNYFKVTNRKAFEELMNTVKSDDEIQIWEHPDDPNQIAFGSYSDINGLKDENGNLIDDSYDKVLAKMQKLLPKDEACIIFAVGHCKLRNVYADAIIITSNKIDSIMLDNLAIQCARKLLNNDSFTTSYYN